jgi:hypothetical protein
MWRFGPKYEALPVAVLRDLPQIHLTVSFIFLCWQVCLSKNTGVYPLKIKVWSRRSLWSHSLSACDTFTPQCQIYPLSKSKVWSMRSLQSHSLSACDVHIRLSNGCRIVPFDKFITDLLEGNWQLSARVWLQHCSLPHPKKKKKKLHSLK